MLSGVEQLKAERNAVSRDIGKAPQGEAREAKIAAMKQVGDRIDALDAQVRETEAHLNELTLTLPPELPAPATHAAPDRVPVLPLPEASFTVVPLPSSR